MLAQATRIEIEVIGTPQTAGSKRAFPFRKGNGKLGVRVMDDNPRSKTWRSQIVDAARTVYTGGLLRGPLRVSMTFYLPRPKCHFGSGRNADQLKGSAPAFPAKKPDALKLARCAEDALTGIVWHDDAQIVEEYLFKRYGEPARAVIAIEEMGC